METAGPLKIEGPDIGSTHPLRKLFRNALDYGFSMNPTDKTEIADYIEEQILCGFIKLDSLYRVRNENGERVDDMADMLAEGDVMMSAQNFDREFLVHKHIGDYTLFMLGMFPSALCGRTGKELLLGSIIVPGSSLSELYIIQGQRSYKIASEFTHKELFLELSTNFDKYRSVMELVRTYLESLKDCEMLSSMKLIGGTG